MAVPSTTSPDPAANATTKPLKMKEAAQKELEEDEEEEDYMSMTIAEPTAQPHVKETYTQRRVRKQREVRPPLPIPPSRPLTH